MARGHKVPNGTRHKLNNDHYIVKVDRGWISELRAVAEEKLGRELEGNERAFLINKTALDHPTPDDVEVRKVGDTTQRRSSKGNRSHPPTQKSRMLTEIEDLKTQIDNKDDIIAVLQERIDALEAKYEGPDS
jgi:hypothetical protein